MPCPSCGADRTDLAAPCPHCGAPAASSAPPPPPAWPGAQPSQVDAQPTGPVPPPRPPSSEDGGRGRSSLVVIGLVVIGLVGIVALAVAAVATFLVVTPVGGDAQTAPDVSSEVEAPVPGTSPPGGEADTLPMTGPDTPPPGLDAELDDLWLACADEDWAACDDLYFRSDIDSDYERFGDTCGYRTLEAVFCETEFGDAGTSPPSPSPTAAPPAPPGQDAVLDDLWSACRDQDWVACDRLYFESEPGSDYELFGATCGTRDMGTGGGDLCQNLHAADGALPVVLPDALEPGMCFDEPSAAELVFWVPTVPCAQPHDVQIMDLVELSESTFPTDMSAVAFERCEPIFAEFVGLAYPESVLDIYHLSPTQESWSLGDRGIACGVYDPAGPVEGSLQGAAR